MTNYFNLLEHFSPGKISFSGETSTLIVRSHSQFAKPVVELTKHDEYCPQKLKSALEQADE